MWKMALSIFLIAHGLIHLGYLTPAPADPKYPFSLSRSWVAAALGMNAYAVRLLGTALGITAALGFVLTGLAVANVVVPLAWYLPLIVVASTASLVLLSIFWHNWLVLGVVIDVVLLVALMGFGWQPVGLG